MRRQPGQVYEGGQRAPESSGKANGGSGSAKHEQVRTLAAFFAAALTISAAPARAAEPAPQTLPVVGVQAIEIRNCARPQDCGGLVSPSGAEEPAPARPAELMPREEFPMPLPKPRPDRIRAVDNRPITRTSSGEVIVGEQPAGSLEQASETPARTGAGPSAPEVRPEGLRPLNFGSLSVIDTPQVWPWSPAVKIRLKFPGLPPDAVASCSGSLIDASHVITAGHCVYNFGGWASSATVYPGAQSPGNPNWGPPGPAPHAPFGSANAVQFHSWTGWTNSRDHDHDIGVIDLDRPVGALAGWYGFGYNNDPQFYKTSSFRTGGYPAASPYDGTLMYGRSGTFDACDFSDVFPFLWYGNQVHFFAESFEGQSGSGHALGSSNVVYAILSNGDPVVPITSSPRITSDKFSTIQGWIGEDTPSTMDLQPLQVTAGPTFVPAGKPLTSMTYYIYNRSTVSVSQTVSVGVYLSANDTISVFADRLIQTHLVPLNLAPKQAAFVTVTTPGTVPNDVIPGLYWLGVILNVSDAVPGNNASSFQDAQRITVTYPLPPNVVTNPATGVAAASATLNATVNPEGFPSTVFFDIGRTSSYGTTLTYGSVAAGNSDVPVAQPSPSLLCNTQYHFRARAESGAGSFLAADRTFTTGACGTQPNLAPFALRVDARSGEGTYSNSNGILEPGESVLVEPAWRNNSGGTLEVTGTATSFAGPVGPAYTLDFWLADYGSISAGTASNCFDASALCFRVNLGDVGRPSSEASDPAISATARPATHWDATLIETPSGGAPTSWLLHVGSSFTDVPTSNGFYEYIERILHHGITNGCTPTTYCPNDFVTRLQMAILIARTQAGGEASVPDAGRPRGRPTTAPPAASRSSPTFPRRIPSAAMRTTFSQPA